MQAEVGDRLVLHGQRGTRIGVVVEVNDGGAVVRWADGGENALSAGTDAPEANATWEAAKAATAERGLWRRGVTAGVGREAALRQEKLALEAAAQAQAGPSEEREAPDHKPAAGE